MRLLLPSRKICLAFQGSGNLVVKTTPHHSVAPSSNNQEVEDRDRNNRLHQEAERRYTESSTLEKVAMRKHDLIKKRPHSSHDTFYKDEEIDKLLEEELQNEKTDHRVSYRSRPENGKNSQSHAQGYPEILDHCHTTSNGTLDRTAERESFMSTSTSRLHQPE